MKFKLDECIPAEIARHIAAKGYDVCTVHQEQLKGAPDAEVWKAAQKEGRFLITTDLDFSDKRRYKPGTHYGILLIRLSQEGQTTITEFVHWLLDRYNPETWDSALVVATDHKLRIRKSNI